MPTLKRQLAVYRDCTDIVCPLIRGGLVRGQPTRVTIRSPLILGKAVWRMAQFFRREFRYDFVQYGYEGRDDDPDHVAFLWWHPESDDHDDFLYPAVGAACFRRRQWQDHPPGRALQWVWLHPFYRRRGLLADAWPGWRDEFGDFVCEPPLSEAMAGFLKKRGECWRCGRVCGCADHPGSGGLECY